MQPLLVSTACGHGSSVTPKSTLVPSFAGLRSGGFLGTAAGDRQGHGQRHGQRRDHASSNGHVTSHFPVALSTRTAMPSNSCGRESICRINLVGSNNRNPMISSPYRIALDLNDGDPSTGRAGADERQHGRQLAGDARQQRDEHRAHDRPGDRRDAADQDHRDELHGHQQVEVARRERLRDRRTAARRRPRRRTTRPRTRSPCTGSG